MQSFQNGQISTHSIISIHVSQTLVCMHVPLVRSEKKNVLAAVIPSIMPTTVLGICFLSIFPAHKQSKSRVWWMAYLHQADCNGFRCFLMRLRLIFFVSSSVVDCAGWRSAAAALIFTNTHTHGGLAVTLSLRRTRRIHGNAPMLMLANWWSTLAWKRCSMLGWDIGYINSDAWTHRAVAHREWTGTAGILEKSRKKTIWGRETLETTKSKVFALYTKHV